MPELSNLRDHLGWLIGRRVTDVTGHDPTDIPDHEPEDGYFVMLHFDNGGTLAVPITDVGFAYENPDEEDNEDDAEPS